MEDRMLVVRGKDLKGLSEQIELLSGVDKVYESYGYKLDGDEMLAEDYFRLLLTEVMEFLYQRERVEDMGCEFAALRRKLGKALDIDLGSEVVRIENSEKEHVSESYNGEPDLGLWFREDVSDHERSLVWWMLTGIKPVKQVDVNVEIRDLPKGTK